jgi:uncharacterized membrane protein
LSALIRSSVSTKQLFDRRPLVVAGISTVVLSAFLIAPGDIASKTHMALHGLCAQRPSHSLQIGGVTLPMDARMTGIYLGAATTIIWLAAARRLRANRMPSLSVVVLLASFVLALGIDGFNALLVDLHAPTLYEPSNMIRLGSGVLAGTSLGVAIGHLFASSIWTYGDRDRAVVVKPADLLVPIGVSGVIALLALSDFSLLYAPFAIGLLLAVVGTFWFLGVILLALLSQRGWSYDSWTDLAPLAVTSLIAAMATVSALASLRFAAEQFLGLPRLT